MKPKNSFKTTLPLCVGHSFTDASQLSFPKIVENYRDAIGEVYFAFPGIATGRSPLGMESGYTDHATVEFLIQDLIEISRMGIKLDLLLNSSCDGDDAMSIAHERRVLSVLEYLSEKGCAPQIVTTASPVTAQIIRNYDPEIEIRASVNMRISTIKGIQYLEHLFDSFCIFRDINRDLDALSKISDYLHQKGKGLTLLANSGCLRACSMQAFHDNAVAHEAGIMTKANLPWAGASACRGYLANPEHWTAFLQNTWIRPEDIHHYEGLVDGIKLATRMHSLPAMVIDAYARQSYHGNLADLFEPGHGPTFAPFLVDNDRFPKDWFERTTACNKDCLNCRYCEQVKEQVFINPENY